MNATSTRSPTTPANTSERASRAEPDESQGIVASLDALLASERAPLADVASIDRNSVIELALTSAARAAESVDETLRTVSEERKKSSPHDLQKFKSEAGEELLRPLFQRLGAAVKHIAEERARLAALVGPNVQVPLAMARTALGADGEASSFVATDAAHRLEAHRRELLALADAGDQEGVTSQLAGAARDGDPVVLRALESSTPRARTKILRALLRDPSSGYGPMEALRLAFWRARRPEDSAKRESAEAAARALYGATRGAIIEVHRTLGGPVAQRESAIELLAPLGFTSGAAWT